MISNPQLTIFPSQKDPVTKFATMRAKHTISASASASPSPSSFGEKKSPSTTATNNLGIPPPTLNFEALNSRIQELENQLSSESEERQPQSTLIDKSTSAPRTPEPDVMTVTSELTTNNGIIPLKTEVQLLRARNQDLERKITAMTAAMSAMKKRIAKYENAMKKSEGIESNCRPNEIPESPSEHLDHLSTTREMRGGILEEEKQAADDTASNAVILRPGLRQVGREMERGEGEGEGDLLRIVCVVGIFLMVFNGWFGGLW